MEETNLQERLLSRGAGSSIAAKRGESWQARRSSEALLPKMTHRRRPKAGGLSDTTVERLLRFESARVETARWECPPFPDIFASYVDSEEGEFRGSFENYTNTVNIVAALLLTISLPNLFNLYGLGMAEEDQSISFMIVAYSLAFSSGSFMICVMQTSLWLISGSTFCGNDLTMMALTLVHYPAGPIVWLTLGIAGLIVALISWIANVFDDASGTAISHIYTWTLAVPLLVMAAYLGRNQQWVWICSFKILAKPALIFWDNAGGDDSVNVVVPQRANLGFDSVGTEMFNERERKEYKFVRGSDSSDVIEPPGSQHGVDHLVARPKFFDLNGIGSVGRISNPSVDLQPQSEDRVGHVSMLRDIFNSYKEFYDVPSGLREPPLYVQTSGLYGLARLALTTKPYDEDPEHAYMQYVYAWQPKPELRKLIEAANIPNDLILITTRPWVPEDADADGAAEVAPPPKQWAVTAVEKALGELDQDCVQKLTRFEAADFAEMAFSDKLAALAALGITDAFQQIKLAKTI